MYNKKATSTGHIGYGEDAAARRKNSDEMTSES